MQVTDFVLGWRRPGNTVPAIIPLNNNMLYNNRLMGNHKKLINQPLSLVLDSSGDPVQSTTPVACGVWYTQPVGQRTCFVPFDAPNQPADPYQSWPAEVIIDLKREYTLTDLYLYIESYPTSGVKNDCKIHAGLPFGGSAWATSVHTFVNSGATPYDLWKRVPTSVTTRFLRIRVERNFGVIRQIAIKGSTIEVEPVTPPVTPLASSYTFDKLMGTNIDYGMGRSFSKNYDYQWGTIRWFGSPVYVLNGSDAFITLGDDPIILEIVNLGADVNYAMVGAATSMVDPSNNSGGTLVYEKAIDFALRAGTRTIPTFNGVSTVNITTGDGVAHLASSWAHKAWLSKRMAVRFWARGMNRLEPENEPDHYARGAGQCLPFDLAAMMSADYDGHEGTVLYLGQSVGIKNSGTPVKMIMPGLAFFDIEYLRAMQFWFENNRLDKKFACDVINGHIYPNTEGYQGGDPSDHALSPEDVAFDLKGRLIALKAFRDQFAPHAEISNTELGIDKYEAVHPAVGDPGNYCHDTVYGNSWQHAPEFGSFSTAEVQGMWLARAALIHAQVGFDRMNQFWLADKYDETLECGVFGASGILALPTPGTTYAPRPGWFYMQTLRNRLKNMKFTLELTQVLGGKTALIHKYVHTANSLNVAYVVWFPTSEDFSTVGSTIALDVTGNFDVVGLNTASETGTVLATHLGANSIVMNVSEIPTVICTKLSPFQRYSDARTAVGKPLSSPEITKYTALFNGLSADGLLTILQAMWIRSASDQAATAINVLNPDTFDLVFDGTPIINGNELQWNGSSANSGFNPVTHLAVANKVSMGYMGRSAVANGQVSMGASDGTNFLWIQYKYYTGNSHARAFRAPDLVGTASSNKLTILTTNGANSKVLYDGAVVASDTKVGAAPNLDIFVGAYNSSGFAGALETNHMVLSFIGGELNDVQAANLTSRINTFLS